VPTAMEPTASQVECETSFVRVGASAAPSQVVQGAFMGGSLKQKSLGLSKARAC
jgi:hypothetical protein